MGCRMEMKLTKNINHSDVPRASIWVRGCLRICIPMDLKEAPKTMFNMIVTPFKVSIHKGRHLLLKHVYMALDTIPANAVIFTASSLPQSFSITVSSQGYTYTPSQLIDLQCPDFPIYSLCEVPKLASHMAYVD
jgi:hypothetical protein